MKKSLVMVLLISLSVLLTSGLASAMDAKEIVEKSIEASGGLENLRSVETTSIKGKALASGMEFPFIMYSARPNFLKLEVEIMGTQMVQAYDGEKGWTINPMAGITAAAEMSGLENKGFALQSDMDGFLVDYEKKGYTIEYVGEDDVEGTPVYHLKVDTNDDVVIDMYFDQEYFLNIKTTTAITFEENVSESDSYTSDFQEVDGVVGPRSIETRVGETIVSQIVIESVEFNVEIDESIFEMPAAETAETTETE